MKNNYLIKLISFAFVCMFIISCKEEPVDFQTNECKRQPAFIAARGFNPGRSAFSTSEKKYPGLVLIELQGNDTTGKRIYQDPSWKTAGWMGPIQIDDQGNCFSAPIPVISVLDNPPAQQNKVYKVDSKTGLMSVFAELPVDEPTSAENPYGVLGLAYSCETGTLYASSVYGSTRSDSKGLVYAINASTGKVEDKLTGTDPIGMGISYMGEKRKLYIGSARTSDVFSVELKADGKFSGKLKKEFSIEGLGPRGDDKVRRIRFDKQGNMQIYGVEFNFNLAAPTEKQETVYTFRWSEEESKWIPQ